MRKNWWALRSLADVSNCLRLNRIDYKQKIIVFPLAAALFFVLSNAYAIQYHYDDLNRLERIEYEDGTNVLYTYDDAGNRLSKVVGQIQPLRTCQLPVLPFLMAEPAYRARLNILELRGSKFRRHCQLRRFPGYQRSPVNRSLSTSSNLHKSSS